LHAEIFLLFRSAIKHFYKIIPKNALLEYFPFEKKLTLNKRESMLFL